MSTSLSSNTDGLFTSGGSLAIAFLDLCPYSLGGRDGKRVLPFSVLFRKIQGNGWLAWLGACTHPLSHHCVQGKWHYECPGLCSMLLSLTRWSERSWRSASQKSHGWSQGRAALKGRIHTITRKRQRSDGLTSTSNIHHDNDLNYQRQSFLSPVSEKGAQQSCVTWKDLSLWLSSKLTLAPKVSELLSCPAKVEHYSWI